MLLDVNAPEVETPPPIVTDLSMMAPMGSSMMQLPYATLPPMGLAATAMPDAMQLADVQVQAMPVSALQAMAMPYAPSQAMQLPVTAMPDWAAPPMSFLQESAGDAAGGIYSEEPIPGCGCQCTQEELAMKEANDNALNMAEFPEEGEPVPWGHEEESVVKAPKFHMPRF
jgi:hypothetical protein